MPLVVLDCEVFINYFLIAFKNLETKKFNIIEIIGENNKLSINQIQLIKNTLNQRITFGYNSNNYDIPITMYALQGKTCKEIFELSKYIIDNNELSFNIYKKFNINKLEINHFDISNLVPSQKVPLKLYGARINVEKLQDLPYNPLTKLNLSQIENIKKYCENDLNITIDLFNKVKKNYDLRIELSKLYNIDLINKSNASIAETILRNELNKKGIKYNYNNNNNKNFNFKYIAPKNIIFKSEHLKDIKNQIENITFSNLETANINLQAIIANKFYNLGIGGLHSNETNIFLKSNDIFKIIDRDVTSYYPSIILNLGLYPKNLGIEFLNIFRNLVEKRINAKKNNNKIENECLKIVINSTFGKFASKFSIVYSPELFLTVTISGQLYLLMLIEMLTDCGIEVISANTDGILSKVKDINLFNKILKDWETITDFQTEENFYKIYSARDVNNYLAIKNNDVLKGKGIFSLNNLDKNLDKNICIDAIINFFKTGESIENYILSCRDITKFFICRKVTGGAKFQDKFLGKIIRWVYLKNSYDYIKYATNENKVANSESSFPIMDLSKTNKDIFNKIDYEKYINETKTILKNFNIPYFNIQNYKQDCLF